MPPRWSSVDEELIHSNDTSFSRTLLSVASSYTEIDPCSISAAPPLRQIPCPDECAALWRPSSIDVFHIRLTFLHITHQNCITSFPYSRTPFFSAHILSCFIRWRHSFHAILFLITVVTGDGALLGSMAGQRIERQASFHRLLQGVISPDVRRTRTASSLPSAVRRARRAAAYKDMSDICHLPLPAYLPAVLPPN